MRQGLTPVDPGEVVICQTTHGDEGDASPVDEAVVYPDDPGGKIVRQTTWGSGGNASQIQEGHASHDAGIDWAEDNYAIYIVLDEGHRIYTRKIPLYSYSKTFRNVINRLPSPTLIQRISMAVSSSSIYNL